MGESGGRRLKGKKDLAGSVFLTTEVVQPTQVLPEPNQFLLNSFGKQIQKEHEELREASKLALQLRISGPLYDNLETPSQEDKLFGSVPEIDDSIRNWPEVAGLFTVKEWDLFHSWFFERKTLSHSENNRASELVRRLKQHLRLCGNSPKNYPHLKEKLQFVDAKDVPIEPLSEQRKAEIRELQKFALSLPEFSDGLTADEMQIIQTYVETWRGSETAQRLKIPQAWVKSALAKMQNIAIHLQMRLKQTKQPVSEGLRVLGSRVYDVCDTEFETALENDWAAESALAERGAPKDDYATQQRFQQDEGAPEAAFGGGFTVRRKS